MRGALALTLALAAFAACAPIASAYIYWTDNGQGLSGGGTTIGRANLDGSGVTYGLINSASAPAGIVSDGRHIYWTNNKAGSSYSIGRANLDGTGANPAFIPASGGVFSVTTDGSYIYWSDGTRYIARAAVDGTGTNLHFVDMGGQAPFGITAYGGTLYIGEAARIMEVSTSGGAPTLFTTINVQVVSSLAAANGYVYWTELGSGVIGRVQTNGTTGFDESYVTGLQYPTGIATDGNELYWISHDLNAIGRATIGASGATNVQAGWISDPGGPWGIAVDSAVDSTRTTLTCNPRRVAVRGISACTALVRDSTSTSIPSGNVVFGGGSSTYFSGGNSCTLMPRPGGGASCTVAAASSRAGTKMLTASYSGDPVHAPSSGAGEFCAGKATQCKQPACKVPKLRGKTLAAARRLLGAAHCRIGKITRPQRHKGHSPLVIVSQQPGPGSVLPNGSKIRVRLGAHHP